MFLLEDPNTIYTMNNALYCYKKQNLELQKYISIQIIIGFACSLSHNKF